MRLYFAPLEGFTDAVYRQTHHRVFPGADKYFMPFVSPSASLSFTGRERFDLDPRNNAGIPAVPQILACNADYFLGTAALLRDAGYPEVNLNLGCPSGTVTAKGKGAGFLKNPDALARFLDAVFARAPLPVSVKTRIGFASPEEWPRLRDILLQYPMQEIIVHPRTGREHYAGRPHTEILEDLLARAPFPVIYNGNVFTLAQAREIQAAFPRLSGLMLGRGVTANPALIREIRGGRGIDRETLLAFHDQLYRAYLRTWPETAVIGRMHAIMGYMSFCLGNPAKPLKALCRATHPDDYQDALRRLMDERELAHPPLFIPPGETRESAAAPLLAPAPGH